MNILILNWRDIKNPKSGGAEIVTFEHAKAWVKAGYRVAWFTSGFEKSKKAETIEGVEIIRRGNFITVYFLAPLLYFFSSRKFDLVIDQIHGLPFFTPLYVRKPKIALIHEVADEIWDYMCPFPINMFGKFIEPFYFKLYKNIKFWTDANSTIDDLVKHGIKKEMCTAIKCPVSNKVLSLPSKKEETPTFIFVSRLVKMKGVEDVIDSFAMIKKDLPDSFLWIVGEGDKKYTEFLTNKTNRMGLKNTVKFFGYVGNEKKLELMKRAHLLLHASIKEGWGLVVVEAASQSTPSVVYNVGGLRESVLNGKTGLVINQNTPEEMASQAIKLLKDFSRYESFQKNCLIYAKDLTWDKSTEKSLELIKELVA